MRSIITYLSGLLLSLSVGCAETLSTEPPDGVGGSGGSGGSGGAATGGGGSGAAGATVEILRDAQGVPHVFGDTEEAAFYGLGYATAEDRLLQMDLHRRYMRGRLAETFGGAGPSDDALINHDRHMRVLGFARHAEAVLAHPAFPPEIRTLLDAYAAGVNALVSAEGFTLPSGFDTVGLTTFEPWTAADSLLVWDRVSDRFNTIDFDAEIALQNACRAGTCETPLCPGPVPIDEEAAVVPAHDAWPPSSELAACFPKPDRDTDPLTFKASHGWAVHGSRTESGEPILAVDPKLEVTAPSFWYAFHLSTPTYSARGIGMAGAPAFLIYWNERVGHTLTAMGGFDIADTYELTVSEDGASYRYDDADHPFTTVEEIIAVRGGSDVTVTVKQSVHGPVITSLSQEAAPGKEYALRHIELSSEGTHSLVGAMQLMGAATMASYRAALEKWRLPGANSVFAAKDDAVPGGHIGYHMAAAIPRRAPNVAQSVDYRGRLPYDGTTSASAWQGFLDTTERPHVIDPPSGYVFSANHMPVGTWYDDYAYTGVTGGGDTFRSHQLRRRLGELLAGDNIVSADTVHSLHFDGGLEPASIFRDMLAHLEADGAVVVPAANAAPTSPAEKAGKVLAALDAFIDAGGELRHTNPYAPLVNELIGTLPFTIRPVVNPAVGCLYGGGEGGANFFLKSFVADPDGVLGVPAVASYVVAEAVRAWDTVGASKSADVSTWRAPVTVPPFTVLHQYNQFCPPSLTGKCSLDPSADVSVPLDGAFGITLLSSHGSSGTGTVDFGAVDAAVSLVPLGVTELPTSPFYTASVTAWLAGDAGDATSTPSAPLGREAIDLLTVTTTTLTLP